MATSQDPITYHANCHCGRFRFDVTVPAIKTAISCTCSLCKKTGALWLVPPAEGYRVVRDDGCLTEYRSSALRSKFCNCCGTAVASEHLAGPLAGKFAVNIRAIREPYVNPFQIEPAVTTVETPDDRVAFQARPGDPSEPPAEHIFACHCGKVSAELLVPIQGQQIKEDNCSSCVRNAYIGVYPIKDQVRIHGREHAFEYLTGRRFGGCVSCRTCGVHVLGNVYGPPIGVFDKLPPERREAALAVYRENMRLQPLSVRALEGVDLGALAIDRSDEGTEGYTLDD